MDASGTFPRHEKTGNISTAIWVDYNAAVLVMQGGIYQDRFAVFAGRARIHVLASTSAEEPALGAFNGTTPFAHYLIEGLQQRSAPTTATRSLRSVANIAKDQVMAIAAKFGFNQVPTIYSFGKDLRFP